MPISPKLFPDLIAMGTGWLLVVGWLDKQVFSSQTAYQITSLLEGVIKRGTGKKLKDLNLNIAGKTGTTNENTDAWFIGFTSDLVVGCLCWNG